MPPSKEVFTHMVQLHCHYNGGAGNRWIQSLKPFFLLIYDLPLFNIYFALVENLKWSVLFLVVTQIFLPKGQSLPLFYLFWLHSFSLIFTIGMELLRHPENPLVPDTVLASIVYQQYNLPLVIRIDHSSQ